MSEKNIYSKISHLKVMHVGEVIKGGVATHLVGLYGAQKKIFPPENLTFVIPYQFRKYLQEIEEPYIKCIDSKGRGVVSIIKYIFDVRNVIAQNSPDIIHAHSSFPGIAVRLSMYLLRKQSVVIYCPHGWSFLQKTSHLKSKIYALIELLLLRKTNFIINISNNEYYESMRMGFPSEKSSVIYNGIIKKKCFYTDANVSFDKGKINLLFVGRLDYQKGIDILINSMRIVRSENVHLYVVGEEVISHKTFKVGRDLDNVTFLGWKNSEDVSFYYKSADATIMPSRWEGFGLVAIESMSQGTPVIYSVCGSLSEINVPHETGIPIPQLNSVALSNIIDRLEKSTLDKLGVEAIKRQQSFFDLECQNIKILKLYEKFAMFHNN